MVAAMAEIADEVVVVAPPSSSELVEQLKLECGAEFFPIEMDRTGINPLRDQAYRKSISEFLNDFGPDYTFSYQAKAAVYSSIAAKSFPEIQTTVLFPGLGYLFAESGNFKDKLVRMLGKYLYRYAFSRVNNFIFQNPDDIQTLRTAGVISAASKVTLVNGSGVPLDQFQYQRPVTEPVRFLYMGRLLWEKGVGDFCSSAKMINETYQGQAEFVILGPLDSNPSAISESQLNQMCDDSNVEYLGVTQDVKPYLENTSVFVLPSYYMEGTPRSILESMAMGRPIITTDSRGCREPIQDGVNGFLVQPKNPTMLYDSMAKFINDRTLIVSMGQSSRQIAEEKYDVRKVNNAILNSMGLR